MAATTPMRILMSMAISGFELLVRGFDEATNELRRAGQTETKFFGSHSFQLRPSTSETEEARAAIVRTWFQRVQSVT
jgi:hypothetical protein